MKAGSPQSVKPNLQVVNVETGRQARPKRRNRDRRPRVNRQSKVKDVKGEKPPEEDDMNMDVQIQHSVVTNPIYEVLQEYASPATITTLLAALAGYLYKYYLANILAKSYFLYPQLTIFVAITMLILVVAAIRAMEPKYNLITKNEEDFQHWLSMQDIATLHRLLPLALSGPGIETATFVNETLAEFWPTIQKDIQRRLRSKLGDSGMLDTFIGPVNKYTRFKIDTLELGKNAPKITGVHMPMAGVKREDIIIEAEMTYDGDLDFRVAGKFNIMTGLKKLYFRCLVRIIVTPLFKEKPTIGTIIITLLSKPRIEWTFVGVLKFLNFAILMRVVEKAIAVVFKNPKRFVIQVAKFIPTVEYKLQEPKGIICVDVTDARNLPLNRARFCCCGTLDPYCVVVLKNQERFTNVVANSDRPEWNKSFTFLYQEDCNIEAYVYDENIDKDDLVGVVVVPIAKFKGKINGRDFAFWLRNPTTGEHITNRKRKASKLHLRISYYELSSDLKKLSASVSLANSQVPRAVISVLVGYAVGLETTKKGVKTPELRALVRVRLGNQTQVTSIQEQTGYPIWDDVLHFLVFNVKLEDVHIEVVDMYYVMENTYLPLIGKKLRKGDRVDWVSLSFDGKVIGYKTIQINEFLRHSTLKMNNLWRLEGFLENAYIHISMEIHVTEQCQAVIDNLNKPRKAYLEEDMKTSRVVAKSLERLVGKAKSKSSVVFNTDIEVPQVNEVTRPTLDEVTAVKSEVKESEDLEVPPQVKFKPSQLRKEAQRMLTKDDGEDEVEEEDDFERFAPGRSGY